jgi:hypothetical protein
MELGVRCSDRSDGIGPIDLAANPVTLETVLVTRFGELPEPLRPAIAAAEIEALNAWISRAARAASLTEVGIPGDGEMS